MAQKKNLKARQESRQRNFERSFQVPATRDTVARYFNSAGPTDSQLRWKVSLKLSDRYSTGVPATRNLIPRIQT